MKIFKFSILLLLLGTIVACGNGEKKSTSGTVVKKKQTNKTEKLEVKKEEENTSTKKEENVTVPPPPGQIKKAKEILASVNKDDVEKVDGAKKFKLFCATCHGFKGDMMVNGAKDLTISNISLENAVAQVYHGKGLMTPYKGVLKDHEIVAVCKYIETLRK